MSAASVAAGPGFIVRNSDLRGTPSFSGKVEVTANKQRGWVRTYQVRAGQVAPSVVSETRDEQRGVLSDLASLSRSAAGLFGGGSRSSGSQTTATIGIRGLGAEELEAARPDKKQLEQLKKYGVSRDAGKQFGKTAKLKKRKIDTLKGDS